MHLRFHKYFKISQISHITPKPFSLNPLRIKYWKKKLYISKCLLGTYAKGIVLTKNCKDQDSLLKWESIVWEGNRYAKYTDHYYTNQNALCTSPKDEKEPPHLSKRKRPVFKKSKK